jgi:hypothetical protein
MSGFQVPPNSPKLLKQKKKHQELLKHSFQKELQKQNTKNAAELVEQTHQYLAGKLMLFLQHIFLFTISCCSALQSL